MTKIEREELEKLAVWLRARADRAAKKAAKIEEAAEKLGSRFGQMAGPNVRAGRSKALAIRGRVIGLRESAKEIMIVAGLDALAEGE